MNSEFLIYGAMNTLAMFMYLRSMFSLIRVRKDIKTSNFIIMVTGIFIMLYGLISTFDTLPQIKGLWSIGHMAGAYVYYIVSKNSKERYFTIGKLYTESLTFLEKRTLRGFASKESNMITKETLDLLDVGKIYQVNDKVQFEKVQDQDGSYHFVTTMKAGGSFGMHEHDCHEMCVPFIGELICPMKEGQQVYKKNEPVTFNPGEIHRPYANEFTVLRVYFF